MTAIPNSAMGEQEHRLAWYEGVRWQVPLVVLAVVLMLAFTIGVLGAASAFPWPVAGGLIAAVVLPGIAVSVFLSLPHRVVFDESGVSLPDRFIPWADVHLCQVTEPHRLRLQLHHAGDPRWTDAEVVEISFPEDLREPLRTFVSEQIHRAHGRHDVRS